MEVSTGVHTIFLHGARNMICTASGSNQKLSSCRGLFTNSGIVGLRIQMESWNFSCVHQRSDERRLVTEYCLPPSSISAWVPSKSRTPAEKLRMSHEIEPVSCDPESAGKRLRQKSLAEWPSKLPQ